MENTLNSNSEIYYWLKQQTPSIVNLLPNNDHFTFMELFELCFQNACDTKNEQMINLAEMLIEQLIEISKPIQSD